MNYGCGSTFDLRDLVNQPKNIYVGFGGGMEVLQFAYFSRQKADVLGVDVVGETLSARAENLKKAENENSLFAVIFVKLRTGTVLDLFVNL